MAKIDDSTYLRIMQTPLYLWYPFPGPIRFGGSEPSPGCPVITQSLKIKTLRKRFQFGARNIHNFNAIRLQNGVSSPFQNDLQIHVQSSNCFYKILISKRKHGMNAHVGAYSKISFFMTRCSSILGPLSITIYHSVFAHW